MNLRQQIDAIAVRQSQIEQHQVEAVLADAGQPLFAARRRVALRSLPVPAVSPAIRGLPPHRR